MNKRDNIINELDPDKIKCINCKKYYSKIECKIKIIFEGALCPACWKAYQEDMYDMGSISTEQWTRLNQAIHAMDENLQRHTREIPHETNNKIMEHKGFTDTKQSAPQMRLRRMFQMQKRKQINL